jgi:hypothetical protein
MRMRIVGRMMDRVRVGVAGIGSADEVVGAMVSATSPLLVATVSEDSGSLAIAVSVALASPSEPEVVFVVPAGEEAGVDGWVAASATAGVDALADGEGTGTAAGGVDVAAEGVGDEVGFDADAEGEAAVCLEGAGGFALFVAGRATSRVRFGVSVREDFSALALDRAGLDDDFDAVEEEGRVVVFREVVVVRAVVVVFGVEGSELADFEVVARGARRSSVAIRGTLVRGVAGAVARIPSRESRSAATVARKTRDSPAGKKRRSRSSVSVLRRTASAHPGYVLNRA